MRKEFVGGVRPSKLVSPIEAFATSLSIENPTGWPTGEIGPFVIAINRGLANEELILCQSRAANSISVLPGGRGHDNTAPMSHAAGSLVEHVLDAETIDEVNAFTGAFSVPGQMPIGSSSGPVLVTPPTEDNLVLVADMSLPGRVKWDGLTGGALPIADGSVTASKLAPNSVTTPAIASDAVTTIKLIDGAVTGVKLANGSVTNTKLQANAVSADKIANDAVTTSKIRDGDVTPAKLRSDVIEAPWTNLGLLTGWSTMSGWQRLRYKRIGNTAFVSGTVRRTSGSNQAIGQLPVGFRPPATIALPFSANGASTNYVQVESDGQIRAIGNAGDVVIGLAVSFQSVMA